mmetsp:Transcript_82987/g.216278  ORF Transcript_82987/g.216278 Transcript_82987/m.216278 type:complete len:528 (-) Transcript_82987:90-1673(-)
MSSVMQVSATELLASPIASRYYKSSMGKSSSAPNLVEEERQRKKYIESLWKKHSVKREIWGTTDADLLDNFKMAKPKHLDYFRRIRRARVLALTSQDAAKPRGSCGLARAAPVYFLEDLPGSTAMSSSLKILRDDPEGAIADCNEALEQDPRILRAWRNRGNVKLQTQDFEGAIDDMSKVLSIQSTQGTDWALRAEAKMGLGDLRGAIADFDEAARLEPRRWKIFWRRAEAKFRDEDFEGAVEDCSAALEQEKDVPEVHVIRARSRVVTGDVKGAEEDFGVGIKYDPGRPDFWFERAEVRGKLKDHDGALKDVRKALQLDPTNVDCWRFSSRIMMMRQEWDNVISDCTHIIHLDPTIAEAFANRGQALMFLNKPTQAIPDLEEAERLDPALPLPAYYAAVAKFKKGLYVDCIRECQHALHANARYKPAIELLEKAEAQDRSLRSWKLPSVNRTLTPRRRGQEPLPALEDDAGSKASKEGSETHESTIEPIRVGSKAKTGKRRRHSRNSATAAALLSGEVVQVRFEAE